MSQAKPFDPFGMAMEFFAIILPGAALLYLVQPWTVGFVPPALRPGDSTSGVIVFVVLAYVLGHTLHALGGKLDKPVYDMLYLRWQQPDHHAATTLVKSNQIQELEQNDQASRTLVGRSRLHSATDANGTSLYDWCLSLIRLQSPTASSEVDRLQSDSKFFRSFAIVMLVAVVVMWYGGSPVFAVGSFLVFLFSLWRFCTLRWDATKRVYEFYLLLHIYRTYAPPSTGAIQIAPASTVGVHLPDTSRASPVPGHGGIVTPSAAIGS